MVETDLAQRVLGLEDFIAEDEEAERSTFELARRLLEVEAKAAWQRATLDACTDVTLVRENEQGQAEHTTRRIKKEIFDIKDE
jgi:hypothetical protein